MAEHTNMDTSHAHRHVDTCQPAQRRPLDSSSLIPTLAGPAALAEGPSLALVAAAVPRVSLPDSPRATRLPHFCSKQPAFLPLALLYGNQPELQTGLLGDAKCPF